MPETQIGHIHSIKNKKIMKKSLLFAATLLLGLCLFTFSSCDDDDEKEGTGKPVVDLKEVGEKNNKTGIAGSDLHLEGEIAADNLIKRIDIEIHQEGGGDFKIEKSFTEGKYIGVKNTHFHEHIDIPAETPAGEYHLHFTVTDQIGQTETKESELTVKPAAAHITVEDLKFGASRDFPDNKIGYVGTKPMVSAHITAENGIEKITVFIHNEDGTPAFELDTTYVFNGEKEWGTGGQHKHVVIPDNAPTGDYHLHFNVYDKKGEVSEHFIEGVQFKKSGVDLSDVEIGTDHSAPASAIPARFKIKADDDLHSVRLRIYKESSPADYFYNNTLTEEFSKGGLKEYAFDKKLEAKDDKGNFATAGEYTLEIRVEYAKGANKIFKEKLNITSNK